VDLNGPKTTSGASEFERKETPWVISDYPIETPNGELCDRDLMNYHKVRNKIASGACISQNSLDYQLK
jgi:hypothetical protein